VATFTSFGLGTVPSKPALRVLWIRRRRLPGSPACEAPESLAERRPEALLLPGNCLVTAGYWPAPHPDERSMFRILGTVLKGTAPAVTSSTLPESSTSSSGQ